jgi:DNA-binding XRE family transcriptional regulator
MTRRSFSHVTEKRLADDPERRERLAIMQRAMEDMLALSEVRDRMDMTQKQVAETLGVSQANISRIEHEEDLYLSTLRDYVEALGGELQVKAVFEDQEIYLAVPSESRGQS